MEASIIINVDGSINWEQVPRIDVSSCRFDPSGHHLFIASSSETIQQILKAWETNYAFLDNFACSQFVVLRTFQYDEVAPCVIIDEDCNGQTTIDRRPGGLRAFVEFHPLPFRPPSGRI